MTTLLIILMAAIAVYLFTQLEPETVTKEIAKVTPDITDTSGIPDPIGTNADSTKVKALAISIAEAEGFFNPVQIGVFIQNRPQRDHNPGDITDNSSRAIGKDGPLNVYQNDNDGWQDLFEKVDRMLSGNSMTYPLAFTFDDLGNTYTGGDNPDSWTTAVLQHLGKLGFNLSNSNTLEDYINV